MATYNDFSRSFTVNAAMSAGRRVALSNNGSIGLAAAEQFGVGVLERDCTADAFENPKVRLPGTGSVSVCATGAPGTVGDILYCLENGQVGPTNSATNGIQYGVAFESWTANGVLIEALPLAAPQPTA